MCFSCRSSSFAGISRAMAKAAGARLRNMGLTPTSTDWTRRAAVCERCPMRVVSRGVSYCGTPYLRQIDRDPVVDGCGCPTRDKAKSPDEHCPVDSRHRPSTGDADCDCKWCAAIRPWEPSGSAAGQMADRSSR